MYYVATVHIFQKSSISKERKSRLLSYAKQVHQMYFCLLSYSFIIPTLPFLYSFSRFLRIDYFISQSMISWLSIKTSDLRFLFIFLFSPVHGESLKINKICCLFMPQNAFNEQNIVNTLWKSFWLINVRTYV